MTESWTTEKPAQRDRQGAWQVLAGLSLDGGLPDLNVLAERLVIYWEDRKVSAAVAVALPSLGAGLLAPGWDRTGRNCLFLAAKGSDPTWSSLPETWQPDAAVQGIKGGAGTGPWPACWTLPSAPDGCHWQELVFTLANQCPLAILVVHPADEHSYLTIGADLQELQDGLFPLLQLWAAARRLEADLGQARTENNALTRLNAIQEQTVAMASHEFKTPLTSITAYTDALRDQITDVEFPHATEFLGVIQTEAGRLLRMVNRILDFSRVGAGLELLEVQPRAIEPLVNETILSLRPALSAKGLRLETHFKPGLPRAEIDEDLVRQVLVNLMSNAIKYTPEGGLVIVTTAEAEASIRVSVADTGLGIADEDLQKIFREFYRSKGKGLQEEGTGLGLTIVRNILNLHGGYIDVRRRPEGGTEFSCYLPKEMRSPAPMPLEFTGRTDRVKGWRVVSLLAHLAAELTGSLAVEIRLRDGRGGLATVAALGPGAGHWLRAELGQENDSLGVLGVGCPLSGEPYQPAAETQLQIIAQMAALALRYLTPHNPAGDGTAPSVQVAKVTEALRSLLLIRRFGIPTSTATSLDLVDKLGSQLGVGAANIRRLQYAALLHDAGMARVEVEIVMGASELSWDQRDEVDRHVEQGMDLMAPLLPDPEIVNVIRHHHERIDGQGYPDGLCGPEIPLGARLLAVVDAWFALTRERSFRPGLSADAALAEIRSHTGSQFDADVVEAFAIVLKGEGIISESPADPINGTGTKGKS